MHAFILMFYHNTLMREPKVREPNVRILYTPSINHAEVAAAVIGANRFRRFGVVVDDAMIDTTYGQNNYGQNSLSRVKSGAFIRDVITSNTGARVKKSDLSPGIYESLFPKKVLGLGLTPFSITNVPERSGIEPYQCVGLSLSNRGALVSLSQIRELKGSLLFDAINFAVAHELGHAFGRKDHCESPTCIMQANANLLDFVTRFVEARLDFCRSCVSIIGTHINMQSYRN